MNILMRMASSRSEENCRSRHHSTVRPSAVSVNQNACRCARCGNNSSWSNGRSPAAPMSASCASWVCRAYKTTVANEVSVKPPDRVDRQFNADHPDQLWVPLTLPTYRLARAWCKSRSSSMFTRAGLLAAVLPSTSVPALCFATLHSDKGTQCLSIRYTERLAEAGLEPSLGSKGDSYRNAMAESDRAFQNGSDQPRGSLADPRDRRICLAGLDRLIQPQTATQRE